jgi:hypothetical protein
MKELLAAVDAATDPEPHPRYSIRVQGAVVDVPPKTSTKLENKARRWMIDEEWLAENKSYDVEARIIASGTAWGDDEDPEVSAEKRKRFKAEKREIQQNKKLRISEGKKGQSSVDARDLGKGKAKEQVGNDEEINSSDEYGEVEYM